MLDFNIKEEIEWIAHKYKYDIEKFGLKIPSASSINNNYVMGSNGEWTEGFWVGMSWLLYENTGDVFFKDNAIKLTDIMINRLENKLHLDHHDIGFLYSLSVVAAYNNTGEEKYINYLIDAAELLVSRFQEKGKFIQCWGKMNDPKQYRLIIDSLMNMPLLYTASNLSGNDKYRIIANLHYKTVFDNVVRADNTTYHTYYFNQETGEPTVGVTAQGNSNDSCWARGQAWSIAGIAFNNEYNDYQQDELFDKLLEVFIKNIPSDGVVYWDFDFSDEIPSAKDTSSNAITACGLLEQLKYVNSNKAQMYKKNAIALVNGIHNNYINNTLDNTTFVTGGTYSYPENIGVNEANLWGDYFYLEALTRINNPNWKKYW